MKKNILSVIISICFLQLSAQSWQPAGDRIKTLWAEEVNPANPLPEYPRPQMVREQWLNLNGLWDYALVQRGSSAPTTFDDKILVPFPIESSLSGVQKRVGEDKELWYETTFAVPSDWKIKDVVLNFGAVDWKADVWINDIRVGSHYGGYTPFSFNITPFLEKNGNQKLTVKVWDPTDKSFQPRGKQVEEPGSIWYTPVTGIWQTVWIEPVEKAYISHLKTVPNIDGGNISVKASSEGVKKTDIFVVKAMENGNLVGTGKAAAGQEVLVSVPNAKLEKI